MGVADNVTDDYSSIDNNVQMGTYLEALGQPGVANLVTVTGATSSYPVIISDVRFDQALILELTAIRDVVPRLRQGGQFRLEGATSGGLVRTEPMQVREFESREGRLFGEVDWPAQIHVKQRRSSFRATLRVGMEVGVRLASSDPEQESTVLAGDLRDLSADGCLAEFSIYDGASKVLPNIHTVVTLSFPDGTEREFMAETRHIRTDTERKVIAVGLQFENLSQDAQKELWQFVKEIEREASRSATTGDQREPSKLFAPKSAEVSNVSRRRRGDYPTPIARRLATIAGYLDSQMIQLKQEGSFDAQQLSSQTDHLLDLLKEDRQEALFALHCLHRESVWVQHGIAVAMRLADLLTARRLPQAVVKGAAAAAMIHDLGKGVVCPEVARTTTLSRAMYLDMHSHVVKALDAAHGVRWLSPVIRDNVIALVNERLDGSGYPEGFKAEHIGQLARAVMVVDVMDALQRPRPDRAAHTSYAAFQLVAADRKRFDGQWLQAYMQRFGKLAIGSLVRFSGGQYAWVVGLDQHNRVDCVRLTPHKGHPDSRLGELVRGSRLRALGRMTDVLVVEE
ncbi:HD domain-containing phosphohydrolase [Pseudidiomarina insulisalsae]|uniref:HD-GYP domain-containing protein n=1 Tax=Pseudidiomarina insulisalsae TaxID=575789 RepID=A0A432YDI3_9GAMM|nr:HD domain-containing phosphohydrolase [Pseudidiomarina insulisalsae]RUO59060.1 hypothetical protein CWI71_09585 [Pseudidiomarina insulisalsae]